MQLYESNFKNLTLTERVGIFGEIIAITCQRPVPPKQLTTVSREYAVTSPEKFHQMALTLPSSTRCEHVRQSCIRASTKHSKERFYRMLSNFGGRLATFCSRSSNN